VLSPVRSSGRAASRRRRAPFFVARRSAGQAPCCRAWGHERGASCRGRYAAASTRVGFRAAHKKARAAMGWERVRRVKPGCRRDRRSRLSKDGFPRDEPSEEADRSQAQARAVGLCTDYASRAFYCARCATSRAAHSIFSNLSLAAPAQLWQAMGGRQDGSIAHHLSAPIPARAPPHRRPSLFLGDDHA